MSGSLALVTELRNSLSSTEIPLLTNTNNITPNVALHLPNVNIEINQIETSKQTTQTNINTSYECKLTTQTYIKKPYEYKPTYSNYTSFIGSNCLIFVMFIYILLTISGICIAGYFTILKGNDMTENYTVKANCTLINVFVTEEICSKTVKCTSTLMFDNCNTYNQCAAFTNVEYYVTDDTSPCVIGTQFNDTINEIRYDFKSGQTISCWTNSECDKTQITLSYHPIRWQLIVVITVFYGIILCNVIILCIEMFEFMETGLLVICISVGICINIVFLLNTIEWIYFGASLIFLIAICVCICGLCVIYIQEPTSIIENYKNNYNSFISEHKKYKYGKREFNES
eukprot:315005_1